MDRLSPAARSAQPKPLTETLAERAYRILEAQIATLRLEPGAWVTEQQLAGLAGLGRTPVREALQRLTADGLVIVYPRRGLKISDINPIDVFQALDTRVALEQLQARDAAARAKSLERKNCLGYAREMRAFSQGRRESANVDRYMAMDHACDALLAEAAGNPFTVKALAPLQTISRRAWYRFCRSADLASAAALHAGLLEAVADAQGAAAESAATKLVEHVRDAIRTGVRGDDHIAPTKPQPDILAIAT